MLLFSTSYVVHIVVSTTDSFCIRARILRSGIGTPNFVTPFMRISSCTTPCFAWSNTDSGYAFFYAYVYPALVRTSWLDKVYANTDLVLVRSQHP